MQESFLTSEEVAKILRVHHFTVLKYIRGGKLRAVKIGRVYRIREKDIDAFIEKQLTF